MTLQPTTPKAGPPPHLTGLGAEAHHWLSAAHAAATAQDARWELHFAEAGRRCGPAHADSARVLLLTAARPHPATLTRLYRQGTAPERRAVLLALHPLHCDPAVGLPLVEDALRTNDTTLFTAALGPYTARHLDAHQWRHAVLKCLFTDVPVTRIDGLAARARGDAELARMLRAHAAERTAAHREIPAGLPHVLALTQEQ
ncbi:hypothetical protein SAM23877_7489 [Streptomyces ambofaciens ATCC 23877]|uniref:Uncharacterized protein SAMT0154 n=1 Tax=Streptomyces ambofaciens (strain ATCC 23877 / 3486 / DSM 40053 / JCM 4204 / NBRC 12836 / NRRL B-2516) TaxID=278992 RepID=Q1RQT2_STRA7|nr:EboA domain-containing protein [Streptomyces ambofaciens]AKZ53233.1 hypothetical protein SAM23877_0184 [Streptomyces ambofaciens ATCC 23877]AKZ60530.1 hypothetical protein SAM23877_7489 [Streptomyces ambofaciens ATCC 23877]CAI78083.1 conserved hypothetical protein [Streptomyces ambofaciens ATCC 23877]CAI78357.1 conserved hypothetical protein [Streptomyces ambofaciens ATCC 23877]CAJ87862.1 conserved hypothetical protein [Streptomyces ambofaciens ATCC 23877]